MEKISVSEEVGGAGGAYSYSALKRLDQVWSNICSAQTGWVVLLFPLPFLEISNSSSKLRCYDMFMANFGIDIYWF